MAAAHILPLYDEFLDYLIEKATPEEILAFRASDTAQIHARDLIEKNSAGTLTPQEQIELDQMLQLERMMTLLKSRALAASKR